MLQRYIIHLEVQKKIHSFSLKTFELIYIIPIFAGTMEKLTTKL